MFNILWSQKRCEILYYFSVHPECGKVLFWLQIKKFWPYFLLFKMCASMCEIFVLLLYKVQIKSSIFLCPVITLCTKKFDLHCNSFLFFLLLNWFFCESLFYYLHFTLELFLHLFAQARTHLVLSLLHIMQRTKMNLYMCAWCVCDNLA